jgi:dimethylamine corrinoid protein
VVKFDLVQSLAELDEDAVLAEVKEQIGAEVPAMEILAQLQLGMEQVGKRYEAGDYFLAELIMSADIFSNATAIMGTTLTSDFESNTRGTMVLGAVKDDIHDIGKNIVSAIVSCHGIKVIDLGVDVSVDGFVEAIKMYKPRVVGLCCLLTNGFENLKDTVMALKAVDPTIRILVGGAPVDEKVALYCGADDYCKNAYDAVEVIKATVGI